MNLLKKIIDNSLFAITLFLIAFIPLYPKLPLLDIKNTWVYIRVEDFLVLGVLSVWAILFFQKKVTLKTPLTIPILIFWLIGALATIHGVLIIFPELANIFPNVAFLTYIRHIEYMSLFFIAYFAIRDKKSIYPVIWTLVITFVLVCIYGLGQRYLSFPAYLTMNEEFAKGVPIQLSQLSRVPSTFAGHYDFAAYIVLMVPIIVSLVFGFRNWILKILMLGIAGLGCVLLFMTVSRVSFFVLFIALFFVVLFQKKKWALIAIPIIGIAGILFIGTQSSLLQRFGSTVNEVDVLVNAKTGSPLGHVQYVPRDYLDDKLIVYERERFQDEKEIILTSRDATSAASLRDNVQVFFPKELPLVTAINVSTGETLPQGTGYTNLALSPVKSRLDRYYYEPKQDESTSAATIKVIFGEYLVKRAAAYDLSFTTRFQGEWPHAIEAFKRNLMLGSGYGSVSLAVDNNYLRILGEIGLLGFASFIALFVATGIYIKKALPNVDSKVLKSFVLGFSAGLIGLALNAALIDVFEASKIAFLMWLLIGVVVGALSFYQESAINTTKELLKAATSKFAVISYLLLGVVVIFTTILGDYFTADDFTWLRWAADCKSAVVDVNSCGSIVSRILHYFFNSDGFFYRPGTKTYFLLLYSFVWLNPVVYHAISIALHGAVVVLLYLLGRRILKDKILSALAAFLYLIASGYLEHVVWISVTGHLFTAVFVLSSLLLYMQWLDKRKIIYVLGSILCIFASTFFHESGVVAPLLLLSYALYKKENLNIKSLLSLLKDKVNLMLFLPVIAYLVIRFTSHSHWFNGDYSYNVVKLPFNFIGNSIGYLLLGLFGTFTLPVYEALRNIMREHILLAIPLGIIFIFISYAIVKWVLKAFNEKEKRVMLFSVLFFFITLLPFLGLGNISSRYSYLATFGVVMILALFIRKLYDYLLFNGRQIAIVMTIIVLSVFGLFHMIQAQQILADWHGAGVRTQNFFLSIDQQYERTWSTVPVELHFTNVPIKNGEAWVFPVGLSDAVWLAFRSDKIQVFTHQNTSQALEQVPPSLTTWMFEFQDNGDIKEVIRKKIIRGEQ